jgi:hypothetical protein
MRNNKIPVLAISLMPITIYGLLEFNGLILTPFYLISPFVCLAFFKEKQKLPRPLKNIILCAILAMVVSSLSCLIITSSLHFLFYVLYSMVIASMLRPDIQMLYKICKGIIYFLSIDVLISVFLFNMGISSDLIRMFFPYVENAGDIRFSSLTSEPSYFAFFVSICMSIVMYLSDRLNIKSVKKVYYVYVIGILFSKTSYGVLLLIIVSLYGVNAGLLTKKAIKIRYLLIPFFISIFIVFFLWGDNYYVGRVFNVFGLLFKASSIKDFAIMLNDTDGSSGMRLIPSILYFSDAHINWQFLFGHGLGTDLSYFPEFLWGDNADTEKLGLGYLPASFYSLGIIQAISILYFILKPIYKLPWVFKVLFVLAIVNCNISTQLFWFIFIMSYWAILSKPYKNEANSSIKLI